MPYFIRSLSQKIFNELLCEFKKEVSLKQHINCQTGKTWKNPKCGSHKKFVKRLGITISNFETLSFFFSFQFLVASLSGLELSVKIFETANLLSTSLSILSVRRPWNTYLNIYQHFDRLPTFFNNRNVIIL